MKKQVLTAALLLALLTAALAGALFIRVGFANPLSGWKFGGIVNPRPGTAPPQITIISPKNNTSHYSRTIELAFNVGKPMTAGFLEVAYEASWMDQRVYLLNKTTVVKPGNFSGSLFLKGVPDGNQSIEIYAKYRFHYYDDDYDQRTIYRSYISGSLTVRFTVDTTTPRVLVLTPQNQTYETRDVPLNFTVNRQAAWMGYSLDGQDNVTVMGNTTLTGLSEGMHTLLVSVVDEVGNEVSEAVTFSVSEPPQSLPLTELVATSVVAVGAALLIYFKKRRRQQT